MDLTDNAAIVTGAASGLGEAVARALSKAGMRVALLDRDADRAKQVAADIDGLSFAVDVSDEAEVLAAIRAAEDKHGVARVLVNCAGIGTIMRLVDKAGLPHDYAIWDRVVRANLYGTFNCMRLVAARMSQGATLNDDGARGVIVNVASAAGFEGQIGQVAYSASKGGVIALTLTAARDLAPAGIRCVTIAPGTFETPIFGDLPSSFIERLTDHHLFPSRAGRPEEFAHAVIFVCENDQMNGTTLRLDAGMRLPPK